MVGKYFVFVVKSAVVDLWKNRLRAFLTTLGIVIGVASVVLLLAFGLGLKQFIADQFNNLGTNLVFVIPGQVFNRSGGFSAVRSSLAFDERDFRQLKKIKLAEAYDGIYQRPGRVEARGESKDVVINAASDRVFFLRNLKAKKGEVFDKRDVEKKAKVAVLGPNVARELFGSEDLAIGQKVRIENQSFRVIGVLEEKGGGGFGGPNFDNFVYLPYKTFFAVTGIKQFTVFALKARTSNEIEALKTEVKDLMLKRYDEDDFTVSDSREILSTIQSIFSVLNMILVGIAAISLVVGGVGIMNIMYVSVTERTREIGIRRAVGAQEKDILFQFLAESVILSLIGGIIGLALSHTIVFFVRFFFPAVVDISSMILAIVVSSAIGIFFGVFPARKAAKLSPIEAIRYE